MARLEELVPGALVRGLFGDRPVRVVAVHWHRIGQTEVCHLWNLVAEDTREGQVFQRVFAKLDEQRRALGGQVFDVLGQAFADTPLRDLLIEAVRYGERGDVRDRLNQVVDETVGATLRQVVHDRALVSDLLTEREVERIRDEMERARARKLQPGTDTFSVTGTELGVARNTAGRHVLALVDGGGPCYLPDGLAAVPDPPFDSAVVTLPWHAFYGRGTEPR